MGDLKPCPLPQCRGDATLESCTIEATIRCTKCGLKISRSHAWLDETGIEAALAAWNSRPLPPEVVAYVQAYRNDRGNSAVERQAHRLEMHAMKGLIKRAYGDEGLRACGYDPALLDAEDTA